MKPSIDPAVLKLAMWLGGGSLLVAAGFMPEGVILAGVDVRLAVAGVGIAVVAWAKRAPGDISVTSHPDDLP